MSQILILTDNLYSDTDYMFLRGHGAHRISTFLRHNGYDTEVIDYIQRWSLEDFKKICEKLVDNRTLMLGVSSNLFYDNNQFNEKLHWFKSVYPNVPIVLGGNHLLSREIDPIDYLIEGYAESALLHLLEYFSGKIQKHEIKWSKFTDRVELIDATADYPYHDTNDLTIEYQDSDFIRHHETLALETARGCIFKCKFCTYPLIGKKKNDFLRDHQTIYDELLYNYETYGVTNYVIAEDTFNDSVEKLENLAAAIRRLPFQPRFASFMRFDLIWSKPWTLELLKEIGICAVYFGIETFNRDDGRLIRKGVDSEKIKEGLLWWAQEAKNIATQVSMIAGLPNSTQEQAWEDNEWLAKSGINWWSWSALWFTDVNKTIHTSDFSHNYRDYGYEVMTDEEVEAALRKQNNDESVHYNTKTYRQKMVYWKHPGNNMDFFKAADLCDKLNNTHLPKKLGGFHLLTYASSGIDVDYLLTWQKPLKYLQYESKRRTMQGIQKYIENKLNYDYLSRTNSSLPKKLIIPIKKNLKRSDQGSSNS